MTKQCSKCGKILPLSEFQRDISKASGYASQCKSCRNESKRRSRMKKQSPQPLKIPDCCLGCIYYRSHSSSGDGVLMGCHYLLDTGHSRLKECGKGVCTVRKERSQTEFERKKNDFLF